MYECLDGNPNRSVFKAAQKTKLRNPNKSLKFYKMLTLNK